MAVAPTLVAALLAATVAATRPTAPVTLHVSTDAEDAPPPTTLQPERPLTPPSLAARRARYRAPLALPSNPRRALQSSTAPPLDATKPNAVLLVDGSHRADLHDACLEFEATLGEGSGACTLMGALYALADAFSSQPLRLYMRLSEDDWISLPLASAKSPCIGNTDVHP